MVALLEHLALLLGLWAGGVLLLLSAAALSRGRLQRASRLLLLLLLPAFVWVWRERRALEAALPKPEPAPPLPENLSLDGRVRTQLMTAQRRRERAI